MSLLLLFNRPTAEEIAETTYTYRLEPTLEAESAPGVWEDLTGDVINAPVRWSRGIFGAGPTDLQGRPGQMTGMLDNTASNEAGLADYYTPSHPNAPAWWKHGTRVRLKLTLFRTES